MVHFRYSCRDYPDTCDFVLKANSNFYKRYFRKVFDLVNNKEIEMAGDILIKIASTCLDGRYYLTDTLIKVYINIIISYRI